MKDNRYVVYGGKQYAFNLQKIKEFCLLSDKETGKESEVVENFEIDAEQEIPKLTSKTSRTLKGTGNPQNDTIVYDMMKLFITTLLTNDTPVLGEDLEDEIALDFGCSLALNTMLDAGFLYEI